MENLTKAVAGAFCLALGVGAYALEAKDSELVSTKPDQEPPVVSPQEDLPTVAASNEGSASYTIYWFQGDMTNEATKDGDHGLYIKYGHLGIAFGKSETIFGFGPVTSEGIEETVDLKKSLDAKVTDDTEVFEFARRSGLHIHEATWSISGDDWRIAKKKICKHAWSAAEGPTDATAKACEDVCPPENNDCGNQEDTAPPRYSLPSLQHTFAEGCRNCATYPLDIGLETPCKNGVLSQCTKCPYCNPDKSNKYIQLVSTNQRYMDSHWAATNHFLEQAPNGGRPPIRMVSEQEPSKDRKHWTSDWTHCAKAKTDETYTTCTVQCPVDSLGAAGNSECSIGNCRSSPDIHDLCKVKLTDDAIKTLNDYQHGVPVRTSRQ